MARTIEGRNGQDVYGEVLENIRRRGKRRQSRNGLTYELEDVTIVLETPEDALPLHTGRRVSRRVAAVEALQLIGGFSDPAWAIRNAPGLKPYLDANGRFYGAYGERIGNQLEQVVTKLTDSPLTRQAVITLWDPKLDNESGYLDYPCTIAIGFSLMGHALDVLNMRVQMRSNDAWLGLPYDMFQFGQLQLTMCNLLGATPGQYVHNAWSLHLYEKNLAESYNVVEAPIAIADRLRSPQPIGLGPDWSVARMRQRALTLTHVAENWEKMNDAAFTENITPSERWYVDALRP